MTEIVFVTAGDPERRTGGNAYNRHVLDRLDRGPRGPVERLVLPDDLTAAVATLRRFAADPPGRRFIVDSIALAPAALAIDALRARPGDRVLALMHMLPSDLLGDRGVVGPALPRGEPPGQAPPAPPPGGPGELSLVELERRLLSVADRVVAVSPALAGRLVAAGARSERVVVVTPGRDACGRPVAPRRIRPGPAPRFLTVANWSEAKGIHLVVAALASLANPRATLDLVGDPGGGPYAARVRDLIRHLGLGERARVHGSLPPQTLADRYAAADAFVLPSRSEGFGIVFAEAMSFALPIVATRVGPIPDLVGDAGLLVPPDDVAALGLAMGRIAADLPLRRRLSDAAARRAALLPTWDQAAERFAAVVEELRAADPARRARPV